MKLTETQRQFAEMVKNYAANRDAYTYSATMKQAQQDKEFENFVVDMTIGRVRGGSALAKKKYKFDYKRKDV